MFTWNFQYISKARLSDTLKQLNLTANQGDILIRIHTAIHRPDEAVELARFIKELVPNAMIFGTSTSAVINWGKYAQNQCAISVSAMKECRVKVRLMPYTDEYSDNILPVDMLCGEVKREILDDETKLLLVFASERYKDIFQFVNRCNDFFPGVPMTGGVATIPQTRQKAGAIQGFVFDEKRWSDQAILIASFSGGSLETFTSYATGIQTIGEETEITDSFRSCILKIGGEDAVDVYQMGMSGALRKHPELQHLFPYVYADADEIPILLNYEKDSSLEELFPKIDPLNSHEYAIRDDLDTSGKKEYLCANHVVKPGSRLKRGFIYDGKIVADNRSLFQRVENFKKAETIFGYSNLIRSSIYANCVKWELSPYENSNMCGCVTAGEITCSNGRNTFGNGAFVVSVLGERPYTQEYNPYAFSNTDMLKMDNPALLNSLVEAEKLINSKEDTKEAERLLTFIRDCENKILYSESEDIPNEAALNMDIKTKEYDRICVINVSQQKEMERVFSSYLIDLTHKNFVSKCLSFARDKKYHIYMLDSWQMAIAESSYRVSLSQFVEDMEALQRQLFQYSEDFISIVPIFCVIDGCTTENLETTYYSALATMTNKNIQFYVCDGSDENNIDDDSIRERYHMVNVINYAIMHDRVIPYYQGIYDNNEKRIHHYESLMRLMDENGKVYYPASFLDIARSFGVLYDEISKIMIRKVFDRFRNIDDKSVSINIGIRDIKNKEVLELIYDSLSQVPHPENFVFEILENEDIEDYNELVGFVDRVHELGGKISIDDFGSGFSNLQHLLSIYSDFLKIDGSIVRNCCIDPESENIIALIAAWKRLSDRKIGIVAEFVENEQIQEKLVGYEVDFSQGYLFSRPSPDLLE